MDGTFEIVPHLLLWLYPIHARYIGKMYPLVFYLLQEFMYEKMLGLLKAQTATQELVLNIKCATVDFETSVINSLQCVYPDVEIKGCSFHFTQCTWWKRNKLAAATSSGR